jgi:hypothetical protein
VGWRKYEPLVIQYVPDADAVAAAGDGSGCERKVAAEDAAVRVLLWRVVVPALHCRGLRVRLRDFRVLVRDRYERFVPFGS